MTFFRTAGTTRVSKVLSGNDISYQWSDPKSTSTTCGVTLYGSHVNFWIQEDLTNKLLAEALTAI